MSYKTIPKTLDNLFYALEPLIIGILMTNILQWVYMKNAGKVASGTRAGSHWQKWSPSWLMLISTIGQMAMPVAVLFIYVGEVGYPESKMWTGGSWAPNTPHGIFFYILKWLGSGCMMVGVAQITQIHVKIKMRWLELRGQTLPEEKVADSSAAENGKAGG